MAGTGRMAVDRYRWPPRESGCSPRPAQGKYFNEFASSATNPAFGRPSPGQLGATGEVVWRLEVLTVNTTINTVDARVPSSRAPFWRCASATGSSPASTPVRTSRSHEDCTLANLCKDNCKPCRHANCHATARSRLDPPVTTTSSAAIDLDTLCDKDLCHRRALQHRPRPSLWRWRGDRRLQLRDSRYPNRPGRTSPDSP